MSLVIVYSGICDRMPLTRKLAIIMQIFAVSVVLGGSYCNYNAVYSETGTDVAINWHSDVVDVVTMLWHGRK